MLPQTVAEMSVAEDRHWWYVGLQDLLTKVLVSPRILLPVHPTVLDVGCGTGGNLRLLAKLLRPTYLGGFDIRSECVAEARRKCPAADIYCSDLRYPEFHRPMYELIVCCDVISSVGLDASRAGLGLLAERLSPGGWMVLHVPACPWLYGDHDLAVGTVERYRRRDIRDLMNDLDLSIEFLSYRMCWLFPMIAAARWMRRKMRDAAPCFAQSDLQRFEGCGTWALRSVVQCENAATCHGIRWPIGSSLFALAQKKPQPDRSSSFNSGDGRGFRPI